MLRLPAVVVFLAIRCSIAWLRRTPTGGRPSVLFVLHDAGETFALNETIRALPAAGVDTLVLPLGQPATDAVLCVGHYAGCEPLPSVTLAELGVEVAIVDGTGGRGQLLSDAQLQVIVSKLGPRAVVTGMNYAMQLQLGRGLRAASGSRFAAFFDGLRLLGSDSDISGALQRNFTSSADEVWIASAQLWPSEPGWGSNFRVVGQPTLQDWQAMTRHGEALRAARARLYGEAALASGAPAICWFGGYGPGYERALREWCAAARTLSSSSDLPGLRFSLASHPGHSYRDLDLRVLKEEGVEDVVALVPPDMKGLVAALASNLTASQGSTGGVQSIFAGKPALFFDPAHSFRNEGNLGVVIGMIPEDGTVDQVISSVRQAAAAGWSVDARKLAGAGVPGEPVAETTNAVLALLHA